LSKLRKHVVERKRYGEVASNKRVVEGVADLIFSSKRRRMKYFFTMAIPKNKWKWLSKGPLLCGGKVIHRLTLDGAAFLTAPNVF